MIRTTENLREYEEARNRRADHYVFKSEIARLEREVIDRAKTFTDDTERREQWDVLVAYRELCRAVDALIEFESLQEKKG